MCNKCVMIFGNTGSVTAKVVGSCPEGNCMPNAIDLSEKAAKQIFNLDALDPTLNVFKGSWLPVPCNHKNITGSKNITEIVIPRFGDAQGPTELGLPKTTGKAQDIQNKELLQPTKALITATAAFFPDEMCGRPADLSRLIPYVAVSAAVFTPDLCGKCVSVKGEVGDIKAHIITGCSKCPLDVVLLSLQAAALINPVRGGGEFQFQGEWKVIDC